MDVPQAHKVRGVSLPQEFMLIRLMENIINPLPSWNPDTPAYAWEGVSCEDETIHSFICESRNITGTLRWEELPRSLIHFSVYRNKLTGEVDLSRLPPGLKSLNGSYNDFTGGVDLCHLPDTLVELLFSGNLLSGHTDFAHLPPNLRAMSFRNNVKMSGVLRFTELPPRLTYRPIQGTAITDINDWGGVEGNE